MSNRTFTRQWLTESGRHVIIPGNRVPEIGESAFLVKAKNATLWQEQLTQGLDGDGAKDLFGPMDAANLKMLENMDLVEDKIVGLASTEY